MSASAVILLLVIGLFLIARYARPACDQQGDHFIKGQQTANNSEKNHLTVSTYNIQTGKSLTGKRDITKSAAVITNADIVGIQEVYASSWLNKFGIGKSQSLHLAEHSGFDWLFGATRRRWFREHRGNAVLSRLPITKWQISMLPDYTNKSYRNMMTIHFSFAGQPCVFINTHLHTRKGRDEQLAIVLDAFKQYQRVILVGDFNTQKDDTGLAEFLNDADVVDAIKVANTCLGERIDWILVKGFNVVDGSCLPKGISDHPYYQVSLKLA